MASELSLQNYKVDRLQACKHVHFGPSQDVNIETLHLNFTGQWNFELQESNFTYHHLIFFSQCK